MVIFQLYGFVSFSSMYTLASHLLAELAKMDLRSNNSSLCKISDCPKRSTSNLLAWPKSPFVFFHVLQKTRTNVLANSICLGCI